MLATTVTFLTVLLVEAIPASMNGQYINNRFVHTLCCYGNSKSNYLTTILKHFARSLVPRPSSSFPSLAVRKSGRGPGTFTDVSDVTDRVNYANVGNMQTTKNLARTHTLEHDYSESKDGSTRRHFYVALHKTVGRTESFTKPRQ